MIPLELKSKENLSPIKISKFIEINVLLDKKELSALFEHLRDFVLLQTAKVVNSTNFQITKDQFISHYDEYIKAISEISSTDEGESKDATAKNLTLAMSEGFSEVRAAEVQKDKYLLRPIKPIIQIRPHSFHFIKETEKFHSMVMGEDKAYFGLQFSYPQIFQDQNTHEVIHTLKTNDPNTELFKKIRLWIRHNTKPTPFLFNGKKIVSTIRIGKECTSWVNNLKNLKPLEVILT